MGRRKETAEGDTVLLSATCPFLVRTTMASRAPLRADTIRADPERKENELEHHDYMAGI